MSAWQFKTKILPSCGLIARYGELPKQVEVISLAGSVPIEELERRSDTLPDFWEDCENSEAVEREIGALLPERESWSSLARMFGESGKDEIEVWRNRDERLSRITVSFSLSEPNPVFVHAVLGFCRRFDLKLLALQSQELFEPSATSFVMQAENCSAARFIPAGRRLSGLLG